MNKRY